MRNHEHEDDLVELGAVTAETKGEPIVGDPDTIGLRKLAPGISDD